jgi:hypothetical protein
MQLQTHHVILPENKIDFSAVSDQLPYESCAELGLAAQRGFRQILGGGVIDNWACRW